METDISKLDSSTLFEYYEDAIRDDHYNPTSNSYNTSGFSYEKIRTELLNRLSYTLKNNSQPNL